MRDQGRERGIGGGREGERENVNNKLFVLC